MGEEEGRKEKGRGGGRKGGRRQGGGNVPGLGEVTWFLQGATGRAKGIRRGPGPGDHTNYGVASIIFRENLEKLGFTYL